MVHFTNFGMNAMDGCLTVLVLVSGVLVLITFLFGRKIEIMTAEIARGERLLMYQTTFITSWLLFSRLISLLRTYLISTHEDLELLLLILYDLYNLCGLFTNSISLLLLFYLSSGVRAEFFRRFTFLQALRDNKRILPVIFTTDVQMSRNDAMNAV